MWPCEAERIETRGEEGGGHGYMPWRTVSSGVHFSLRGNLVGFFMCECVCARACVNECVYELVLVCACACVCT